MILERSRQIRTESDAQSPFVDDGRSRSSVGVERFEESGRDEGFQCEPSASDSSSESIERSNENES